MVRRGWRHGFRSASLVSVQLAVHLVLLGWAISLDMNAVSKSIVLVSSFALVVAGLLMANRYTIYLQTVSLLLLNVIFVLNSLRLEFTYPNAVQLVVFQTCMPSFSRAPGSRII